MKTATYTNPLYRPAVVGFRWRHILLVLLLLLAVGAGVGFWVLKTSGTKVKPKPVEAASVTPSHLKQALTLSAEEPAPVKATAPAPDPSAAILKQLAAIQTDLQAQRDALAALKRQPVPPPPPRGPQPAKPPDKPKPPGSMLFVSHDLKDAVPVSRVPEYTLAPGATKIPFVLETKVVSDVEGYLTARVTANIFDTETGRHLLVPQGSTILGNTQSSKLVYGDERMDTVSLKLTLPDGRSVDLGRAPITDQEGVAGLGGEVDQHYGRLLAAVLIQGVLKGGAQAVSSAAAGAGGAGQVVVGVTGTGAQTTTQITGPLLNTRPTITAEAGQLGTVILLKELKLPEMWR